MKLKNGMTLHKLKNRGDDTLTSRTKYRSISTKVNGITYASKKEAQRHHELVLLERAGIISELRRQVKFELIPAQRMDGKCKERAASYIADFTYKDKEKKLHVEDVKGYKKGQAYAIFTLKRKLMLYIHGIEIEEI